MKIIHPARCWCPTCFPIDGPTVSLSNAKWQDIKAAVENTAAAANTENLNQSGDHFILTTSDDGTYTVAQLESEQHITEQFRQFWMWKKETGK